MAIKNTNPLLCDPQTGVCEIPGTSSYESVEIPVVTQQKPLQVIYFTDPICSSCWGIEPQLRKLKQEYGDHFNIEYRMGGLLPSWNVYNSGAIAKPSDVAHHWDEVSAYFEMPIDGNVWLEDPLHSSYPPSIAFIAAKMQDIAKADKFFRRIKEMVFLEKKNITRPEHLREAAKEAGLELDLFEKDLKDKANELFAADLDYAHSLGVRSFPTLFFTNEAGDQRMLKGVRSFDRFENIVLDLCPGAEKKIFSNSLEDFCSNYPSFATKEFAVITDRTMEEAEKILHEGIEKDLVEKIAVRNGDFWKRKLII